MVGYGRVFWRLASLAALGAKNKIFYKILFFESRQGTAFLVDFRLAPPSAAQLSSGVLARRSSQVLCARLARRAKTPVFASQKLAAVRPF